MSIIQIIGFIIVCLIGISPMFLPWAIRVSAEAERKKRLENFPDKIIINIKHEKVSDDENEDRDCQKHTANRRNFS